MCARAFVRNESESESERGGGRAANINAPARLQLLAYQLASDAVQGGRTHTHARVHTAAAAAAVAVAMRSLIRYSRRRQLTRAL